MKKITRIDVTTDNSAGSKGLFVLNENVQRISGAPERNEIDDFFPTYSNGKEEQK